MDGYSSRCGRCTNESKAVVSLRWTVQQALTRSHRFNILICSVSRALYVMFLSRLRGRDQVNFGIVDVDLTNNHR